MNLSLDLKCSITVAILTVLIYLFMVQVVYPYIMRMSNGSQAPVVAEAKVVSQLGGGEVGASIDVTEWYKSMEIIMLVSVFLAFNVNNMLFDSCIPMQM